VVHDAGAAGLGEELGAEPDQAARRDDELQTHPAGAVVDHLLHATLAGAHELRDGAEVLLGDVDGEALDRLVGLAVDLAQTPRLADGELEALAAHHLDQDGQLQLAAALHLPGVGAVGGLTLIDTLPMSSWSSRALTAGGRSASCPTAAGQRRGVDADRHRDRRLVDVDQRQRTRVGGSDSVSPMVISGMPAMATMSPGPAESAGTRSRAFGHQQFGQLDRLTVPSRRIQATCWPRGSCPPRCGTAPAGRGRGRSRGW
jgi:hypothetical protein